MTKLKILIFFAILSVFNFAKAQEKTLPKEILLIGTFHFNNPGADIAKSDKFDVMLPQPQRDLDEIAKKIKDFSPDKIFVEWDYNDSLNLDTLYNLYLKDEYFNYINKNNPKSTFYKENEIFQLAFRAAKLSNNKKVYGIDIQTDFPFDSLISSIEKANQIDLKNRIFERISLFENIENQNRKKLSLVDLILETNKESQRKLDLSSYITLFNKAGALNDFIGPDLVANWYKRNLLMYSFLQKITENKDTKIMVLLGSSHIALFKQFADLDENFKVVELHQLMNPK